MLADRLVFIKSLTSEPHGASSPAAQKSSPVLMKSAGSTKVFRQLVRPVPPSWGEDELAAPITLPCPGGSSRRLLPCKPWATPHSMRTSWARPRRAVPGGTGGPHP